MDAYERKYQYVISEVQKLSDYNPRTNPIGDDLMGLALKISEILIKTEDKESMQRMITLLEEDIKLGKNGHLFSSLRAYNKEKEYIHTIVSLSLALDNNNPSKRLMEIYEKYSVIPVVFETYYYYIHVENPTRQNAQRNYTHGLINEIIEQAAKIGTEDVYAMLYQILQTPSAFGIQDADSKDNFSTNNLSTIKRIWEILGSSGNYNLKFYLAKFITNPDLSDIGVIVASDEENPEVVQFGFERAAFEAFQKLPAENQPSHKELINMLILIYQRHKDNQQCKEFAAGTLEQILQPNDTECIPILQELLSADDIRVDIPGLIAKNVPDSVFIDELISGL